jgi:hypothetical protein
LFKIATQSISLGQFNFYSGYFGARVLLFAQASLEHGSLMLMQQLEWQVHTTILSFLLLRWGLTNFIFYFFPGTTMFPVSASQYLGVPGAHHCVQLSVSQTFCSGWSQTMILPTSAFQVARITGVSHLKGLYSRVTHSLPWGAQGWMTSISLLNPNSFVRSQK